MPSYDENFDRRQENSLFFCTCAVSFFTILFCLMSVPDTSRLVIKRRTIAQAQSDLVQKIGELESISDAILVGNVTRLEKIMEKIGLVSNDYFALCR